MDYLDVRSTSGAYRHVLSYDLYDQAAEIMKTLRVLTNTHHEQTLIVTILKNGNVFLGHGIDCINKRFIANNLIDGLQNYDEISYNASNIREIMKDAEIANSELRNRNIDLVKSLGFELSDIDVKFVGFSIVTNKHTFYTDAIGLVELTGDNGDSFYNAMEIMK